MLVSRVRYVAKAIAGRGWHIWNRKTERWWGEIYIDYPDKLLSELNNKKNPDKLVKLTRIEQKKKKIKPS